MHEESEGASSAAVAVDALEDLALAASGVRRELPIQTPAEEAQQVIDALLQDATHHEQTHVEAGLGEDQPGKLKSQRPENPGNSAWATATAQMHYTRTPSSYTNSAKSGEGHCGKSNRRDQTVLS